MSILSAIGNTPLIEFTHINGNNRVRIFGKLEGATPVAPSRTVRPGI